MTKKEFKQLKQIEQNKKFNAWKTYSEIDKEAYEKQGTREWCNANGLDYDLLFAPTLEKYLETKGVRNTTKVKNVRKETIKKIVTENEKPEINNKQFRAIKDRTMKNFRNYTKYKKEGKQETAKSAFVNIERDLKLLEHFGFKYVMNDEKTNLEIDNYKRNKFLNRQLSEL